MPMTDQAGTVSAKQDWPASQLAWYAVIVLALSNTLSLIDRTLLSFLLPAVQKDLAMSDTVASLLVGPAFTVFYCFVGLPLARLADTKSRKTIILIGVAFWSLMTALSGVARNFWQMSLMRMGVAVGSTPLSPASYSIMADYFPPQKLALPLGIFSGGVTLGIGLSFIGGAAAIGFVSSLGDVTLPILGTLSGWRLVFVIFGAIGIPIVLMCAFLREPDRRGIAASQKEAVPFAEIWQHIQKHWKIYLLVAGGYGATSVSIYGIISWTSAFYGRVHGVGLADAGYLIGLAVILGGPLGAFAGGWLSDWLEKRGDTNAKCKVLWWGCIGLIPPGVLAPLMPSAPLAATVLAFSFFFGSICSGPAASLIQIITPNRMRAQFGALYQLALNLVGLGLGPTFVALLTDYVFQDPNKVGYSMIWGVLVFDTLAVLMTYLAYKHYPKVRDQLTA